MNPAKNRDIPLYIYHAGQCDPKKCTGRKMARFELARLYDRVLKLPRSAILLDPMAEKALSPADDPGKGDYGNFRQTCNGSFPCARMAAVGVEIEHADGDVELSEDRSYDSKPVIDVLGFVGEPDGRIDEEDVILFNCHDRVPL